MRSRYARAGRSLPIAMMLFAGLMLAGAGAQADARHYGKWKSFKVKLLKLKDNKNQSGGLRALDERVSALEERATEISVLEVRIGDLEMEVAAIQADLASLSNVPDRLATLEAGVAALNTALADQGGDVSALTTRVADVEAAITGLVSRADFDALALRVLDLESAGGGGGGSGPTSIDVNCAAGDTISSALAAGDPSRALVVTVIGLCNEIVTVRRDDVTLRGGIPMGELTGEIILQGSNRVVIQDLDIINGAGAGVGVHIDHGSSADLSNVLIFNHVVAGLRISKNSVARLGNVEVNNPSALSVHVSDSSDLSIQTGATPFTGPVAIENNSNADLGTSGIFSGLSVSGHSRARLGGATVFNGVSLSKDSMLQSDGASVSGGITCSNDQNLVVDNGLFGGIGADCTVE